MEGRQSGLSVIIQCSLPWSVCSCYIDHDLDSNQIDYHTGPVIEILVTGMHGIKEKLKKPQSSRD